MEYISRENRFRWENNKVQFSSFRLESGHEMAQVQVAFEIWEPLNGKPEGTVLVCHALTGNAHAGDSGAPAAAPGWWNGLVAPSAALDPAKYQIICSNVLGSCYGTTGPASTNPQTGRPFGHHFPEVTVRDMVRLQKRLLERLEIAKLKSVIGGSLGGMQALEWGVMYPEMVESIIPMACLGRHSAWGIAWNEVARMAILNSGNGSKQSQIRGLALARMAAMISYRTPQSYNQKFGRDQLTTPEENRTPGLFPESQPRFQVENYLRYQGQKLVERFDAPSYITLSRAIDNHDISVGRGSTQDVLGSMPMPALCIGISSDLLYPPEEMKLLARGIPRGIYREIRSIHGHDAFLIEYQQLNRYVGSFLQELTKRS